MKRFEHFDGGMDEHESGGWVQYAEASYAIAQRDARIAELETQLSIATNMASATLEKAFVEQSAQRKSLAQRDARIAELEAAIDNLAKCKGRFHTEANFKALIEVRNKNLHK